MVYKFFDKKPATLAVKSGVYTSGGAIKSEFIGNQRLAEKLHKPVIRKFGKRKVHSSFMDKTEVLIYTSKYNNKIRYFLYVIDVFSKCASVVLKGITKGITITNAFQKVLDESSSKLKKIWVDKGNEFYNKSMKLWLQENGIEIYSTHNEGKSVAAERFIGTLKNKIYKYILNNYNYTYHKTIKIKPIDVKSIVYIDSGVEDNDKNPKFLADVRVEISKYKN